MGAIEEEFSDAESELPSERPAKHVRLDEDEIQIDYESVRQCVLKVMEEKEGTQKKSVNWGGYLLAGLGALKMAMPFIPDEAKMKLLSFLQHKPSNESQTIVVPLQAASLAPESQPVPEATSAPSAQSVGPPESQQPASS